MRFELEPPLGVGGLLLGMTADDARAALVRLGDVEPDREDGLYAQRPSALGFTAHLGADALVEAIEIWRPEADDTVHYRGVDIFGRPALEVVDELRRHATVLVDEDDDASYVAPDLLLALWRPFAADDPGETQGYYFSSVLVARPGYYDAPEETG
jgi:hypothetical protein